MAKTTTKAPEKKQTEAAPQPAPSTAGKEVALVLQKERLPYHPLIEERFGVDRAGWRVIVEAIWPGAKSVESVVMALSYCRARHLDPFKRPVHIVPVYNSALRATVESIWPGISELRTTAMRTGSYAGCDPCVFGEDIEKTFFGQDKDKREEQMTVTFPEWAQITVYRMLNGNRVPFPGPRVYWEETYATKSFFSEIPNSMWESRPRGQVEKCAEAAALRRAYPEELGNEYAAEEMAGRVVDHGGAPVLPAPDRPKREDYLGKPAIEGAKTPAAAAKPVEEVTAETVKQADAIPEPEPHPGPDGGEIVVEPEVVHEVIEEMIEASNGPAPQEFIDWFKDQHAALGACKTEADVEVLRNNVLEDLGGMDDEAAAWKAVCAERGSAIWKAAKPKKK